MTSVAVASVARARVDRIKTGVDVIWSLIVESYQARDWESLGYSSWDDMCTREFGTARIRLPREERTETVQSLRSAGLSLRAIASATGTGTRQVQEALHREVWSETTPVGQPEPHAPRLYPLAEVGAEFGVDLDDVDTVDEDDDVVVVDQPAQAAGNIIGIDGKQYAATKPASSPKPSNRKPLTEEADKIGWEFRRVADRLAKLVLDDRLRANEKQVALVLRGHLLYVAETVAAVLDQLPN